MCHVVLSCVEECATTARRQLSISDSRAVIIKTVGRSVVVVGSRGGGGGGWGARELLAKISYFC